MLSIGSVEELTDVLAKNDKVVLDVWAEWCRPCKMFGPMFEKTANNYAGTILFAKVNIEEAQDVAQRYGIQSIPTVIYFKNGKETGRNIGIPNSEEAFIKNVENNLEK